MAAYRRVVASAGRSRIPQCARSLARLRLALHHPGRPILGSWIVASTTEAACHGGTSPRCPIQQWLGKGGMTIGHAGGIPGFQSAMWCLTKPRASVVVFTNTDDVPIDAAYRSLETIVLEHLGV